MVAYYGVHMIVHYDVHMVHYDIHMILLAQEPHTQKSNVPI
jgi:hypothetical protein